MEVRPADHTVIASAPAILYAKIVPSPPRNIPSSIIKPVSFLPNKPTDIIPQKPAAQCTPMHPTGSSICTTFNKAIAGKN